MNAIEIRRAANVDFFLCRCFFSVLLRTVRTSGSSVMPVTSDDAAMVPSPVAGATKPSPHGRLPKAPGAVRSPSSAIARAPGQAEPEVAAARAGEVRLFRICQQIGDRPAAGGHRVEVDAHESREELLVHAGERRAARAVLRGGLPGDGVRQRRQARAEERGAGRERRRDRLGRLGAPARVGREDRQRAICARAQRRGQQRPADALPIGVADDQHVIALCPAQDTARPQFARRVPNPRSWAAGCHLVSPGRGSRSSVPPSMVAQPCSSPSGSPASRRSSSPSACCSAGSALSPWRSGRTTTRRSRSSASPGAPR